MSKVSQLHFAYPKPENTINPPRNVTVFGTTDVGRILSKSLLDVYKPFLKKEQPPNTQCFIEL
jgi:hypothetical protein